MCKPRIVQLLNSKRNVMRLVNIKRFCDNFFFYRESLHFKTPLARIFLPKSRKFATDPILVTVSVTLLQCNPTIVNAVVKMRPHPAAHPH